MSAINAAFIKNSRRATTVVTQLLWIETYLQNMEHGDKATIYGIQEDTDIGSVCVYIYIYIYTTLPTLLVV